MDEFKKRQNQIFDDNVSYSEKEISSNKENLFKFTSKRKILYSLLNSLCQGLVSNESILD